MGPWEIDFDSYGAEHNGGCSEFLFLAERQDKEGVAGTSLIYVTDDIRLAAAFAYIVRSSTDP